MNLEQVIFLTENKEVEKDLIRKPVIYISGQGNFVDKQSEEEAYKAFYQLLYRLWPKKFQDSRNPQKKKIPQDLSYVSSGRYGYVPGNTHSSFEFDSTMSGSGHPNHWKHRGYFLITHSFFFLFPKDDNEFRQEGAQLFKNIYGKNISTV